MLHRIAALLLLPLVAASEETPVEAAAKAALLERHAVQPARMEELAELLARSIHLLESALGQDPRTRGSPAAGCPRGGGCRGPASP